MRIKRDLLSPFSSGQTMSNHETQDPSELLAVMIKQYAMVAARALVIWWAARCVHEAAHVVAAVSLGHTVPYSGANVANVLLHGYCQIPGLQGFHKAVVHHSAWIASVALFALVVAREMEGEATVVKFPRLGRSLPRSQPISKFEDCHLPGSM